MKSSISFFLIVICTVVLAAQQSQAKKGCNAYGHACYGGHGKRSLGSLMGGNNAVRAAGATVNGNGNENDERADIIYPVFPNEASVLADSDIETYPKYRLIKIMKSWLNGGHSRRQLDRINELDYPMSDEAFTRDNII